MEEEMNKRKSEKMQNGKKADARMVFNYVLRGLRNAVILAAIIIGLLLAGSIIVSLVTKTNIGRNMYMSCYYGSIFVLIVSIPQFYKRNKIGKGKQVRQMDTMFGFYGWFGNKYEDEAMENGFEQFQGDGFWLGIMLIFIGLIVIAAAVILENIFLA
jgi:hypothetical protein